MKQILEILDKYYGGDYNVDCAKEIHQHYLEFTDWMMKGTIMPDPDVKDKYWDCLPQLGEVS